MALLEAKRIRLTAGIQPASLQKTRLRPKNISRLFWVFLTRSKSEPPLSPTNRFYPTEECSHAMLVGPYLAKDTSDNSQEQHFLVLALKKTTALRQRAGRTNSKA